MEPFVKRFFDITVGGALQAQSERTFCACIILSLDSSPASEPHPPAFQRVHGIATPFSPSQAISAWPAKCERGGGEGLNLFFFIVRRDEQG
jgi:hypothetical protein